MEVVKTLRVQAAIFGHSVRMKRAVKACFGGITAVFLLHFYYVQELLFVEMAVALGVAVMTLIGAVYALGCTAVSRLRRLGFGFKAVRALASVRQRQAFAKTTTLGISK